jgi:predicted amino acid dehydrogenase
MKEIVSITMGTASENTDNSYEIMGENIRVKQLGTDFNIRLIKNLIKNYRGKVDVMTISGLPNPIRIKNKEIVHPLLKELKELAHPTPLVDGTNLRNLVVPWSINHFLKKNPDMFKNKRVGFFMGTIQKYLIDEIANNGAKLLFGDIYFFKQIPILLRTKESLEKFLLRMMPILVRRKLKKLSECDFSKPFLKKVPGFKDFFDCDFYVVNSTQLDYIKLPDLTGKSVIIESLTPSARKKLENKNVAKIYQCSVDIEHEYFEGFTKLEALLQVLKDESTPLTQSEIQNFIEDMNLRPKAVELTKSDEKAPNRFAFIIHPLSASHLLIMPGLRKFRNQPTVAKYTEKICAALPSFLHGQIKGIKSEATGQTAIGDIYAVTETPRIMMNKPTQKMYDKLIDVTKKADMRGNSLIGLGAFTKIVGDAGVTINKFSPIPVTTGNSLSAASTLWAASYAIDKMDFIRKKNGKYPGTVMIVGATGSIGKVNSKVLCQYWERVVIVAPKLYKLIDLKDEMHEIEPNCEIVYSTNPEKYLSECDLIITTTSARGKKILDIEKVRPGCVICDVSRPFDISEADMLKRPDVLVIASGQVELPGNVDFDIDIGLSGNTVYACLAETALLALEGRFESFSLSRDISYQKVFDIDQMARKHGVRLSAIMGHSMEITDNEIELCRQHALKNRDALKIEREEIVIEDNLEELGLNELQ